MRLIAMRIEHSMIEMTARSSRSSGPRVRRLRKEFFFAEDPSLATPDAAIFWSGEVDPRVVQASAQPAGRHFGTTFALPADVDATVLLLPDREEISLSRDRVSVRLSLIKGSMLNGSVELRFHLSHGPSLPDAVATIERFARFFGLSPLGVAAAKSDARCRRRSMILRTLDALAIDPRHRSVARALFGDRVVSAGWNGGSDFLRSRVRRLIRQATKLANADPSQLLSGR